jgi:hypothetical protein
VEKDNSSDYIESSITLAVESMNIRVLILQWESANHHHDNGKEEGTLFYRQQWPSHECKAFRSTSFWAAQNFTVDAKGNHSLEIPLGKLYVIMRCALRSHKSTFSLTYT